MTVLVEFRILGSLEARVGERAIGLGGVRPRSLLAMLLLEAGRSVSVDRLVEGTWGESPPASVRSQVAIHVHALRKAFREAGCAAEVIATTEAGYRLLTEAALLDVQGARRLVARAGEAVAEDRPAEAADLLDQALALWRGPVLDGLDNPAIAAAARPLEELRLTVIERRVESKLAIGQHRELVGDLSALVAEHPLQESLRRWLMLALARSGRHADALESYQEGRRILDEELGLEPGRALQELQGAILRDDPSIHDAPSDLVAPATVARPAQLPPVVSAFSGRERALEALNALLERTSAEHLPVAMISGVAGVGKTSLAVYWSHRMAGRFPDGQLFADLRGYHEHAGPTPAGVVLERFLRALGVPGEQIPADAEERATLFRSMVDQRRMLILLDNAASGAQVRPLLPGSARSCVIVTTRRRLEGLVAADGAHPVPVDVLSVAEARDLLARVAGTERVAVDPGAAVRLSELCDGLPLALRIAAARLANRPDWSLAELADRLAGERNRLDQLSQGELQVRGSFELSYRDLPESARRAFRRLGLIDAPGGIAPWQLAALMNVTVERAEDLLEQLVDAHLLQALGHDAAGRRRYRLHDLIRLFARERADAEESSRDRDDALRRVFGGFLTLAEQARISEYGAANCATIVGDARRWTPRHEFRQTSVVDPLDWLEADGANLRAAVAQSAALGWSGLCWQLVSGGAILHAARGHFDDWHAIATNALTVCERAGERRGEAAMRLSLGMLYLVQRRFPEAVRQLTPALELFGELRDDHGWALAMRALATVRYWQGDLDRAQDGLGQAVRLLRQVGDVGSESHALGYLAQIHELRGQLAQSAALLDRALVILPANARRTAAQLLKRRAQVYHRQGEHAQAIEDCKLALSITHQAGDSIGEAYVLHTLGEVKAGLGDRTGAEASLNRALWLSQRVPERLIEARVRLTLGKVVPEGAVEQLRAAAAIFAELGAESGRAEALTALAEYT
ncbi:BTAD domain-containing putative transcriptional regulator [Nonomuraea sp. NPDC050404]|uniref:AfsR/SARP family transcriptional regulator n=1 Tax=Nonomuraea sp. NPDC050404 TaxID=3155783 RepID=UPI0033E6F148